MDDAPAICPTCGRQADFRPDWVSLPGETIAETIEALGMSRAAAAKVIGIPQSQLTSLIKGRRGIGPSMALRLERALGPSAEFWIARQGHYDVGVERKRQKETRATDRP